MPTAREDVAHLLRRAGFGGLAPEIDALTPLSRADIVERLLDVSNAPAVVMPAELSVSPADEYNRWVAGDAGLYFGSPGDVDLAVSRVLDDAELRQRLSSSARARFNDEFTWDKVAGEYESLLWKAKSVQAASRVRSQR